MIVGIRANKDTFKPVSFKAGLNVVVAQRLESSERRDTRNGLGKSTLIDIMHFCLGSAARKGQGVVIEALSDWIFVLDLVLDGNPISASRSVGNPSEIRIIADTDISGWSLAPRRDMLTGEYVLAVDEWVTLLGTQLFNLPFRDSTAKYQPSFRSLISYFIRRGKDAYSNPFEHYRKQSEGDKQVNTTFLLGLAWQDASEWQVLRDRQKRVESLLGKAAQQDLADIFGSRGELEVAKVRLENRAQQEAQGLETFRVLPQYRRLESRANILTEEIHRATNANIADTRLLDFYRASVADEQEPSLEEVSQVYSDAGVALPGIVLKRLEDVQQFHKQLVENRRQFLNSEISRLERTIGDRNQRTQTAIDERAQLLDVLRTHGALEEYTQLTQLHSQTLAEIHELETRIDMLRKLEDERARLRLDMAQLEQRARLNYEVLRAQRSRAIEIFNSNSETLYSAPGTLAIDIGPNGYQFRVEIERSGSTGIENMKVFCYDLMLAELWAEQTPSPCLLVHDSLIYDGVDERQRALALELAARKAEQNNYYYICTLNSDMIPWDDFSSDFDFNSYVVLELADAGPAGRLLGIHF